MAVILTLLLGGIILLALETVLPGLVAGAFGLLCLAAAVVVGYRDYGLLGGNLTLVAVGAILGAGAFLWLRFFPQSRWGRRFVSDRAIGGVPTESPDLLHRHGTALTNLRPSGTATIDGRRIDVVTEGAMVAAGTPVRVVALEGIRVVVRPLDPISPPPHSPLLNA